MQFTPKTILLKDGREAVLRSPTPEDAAALLDYLRGCAEESDFLLCYPEECPVDVGQEQAFLEREINSPDSLMIACFVSGEIAGNCNLVFNSRLKMRHRAGLGVAVRKNYWCLGIGSALLNELAGLARERGVSLLELEFIEGNTQARALYEKLGFRIVAVRPDAYRTREGKPLAEFVMAKEL